MKCPDCRSSDCPGCGIEYDPANCLDCGTEFQGEGDFCSRGCEDHYGLRQANLQRWDLRPKGTEIVINKRRVA